jgi:hypothetical protein
MWIFLDELSERHRGLSSPAGHNTHIARRPLLRGLHPTDRGYAAVIEAGTVLAPGFDKLDRLVDFPLLHERPRPELVAWPEAMGW